MHAPSKVSATELEMEAPKEESPEVAPEGTDTAAETDQVCPMKHS